LWVRGEEQEVMTVAEDGDVFVFASKSV
jgi:hypothetical protein